MTPNEKSEIAVAAVSEDIFEFNIRYEACPECGGRCSCMNHCDTNFWPYRHQLAENHTTDHIRKEKATKGMAKHKAIIAKALAVIRKIEEKQQDVDISEGQI